MKTRPSGSPAIWSLVSNLSVSVAIAIILFYRLRLGSGIVMTYEDDFFYYLKVAMNLVAHGRPTFDITHLTNGYHPLWLLLIAVLYRIHGGRTFFVELQIVLSVLTMTTFVVSRRLFSFYTSSLILPNVLAIPVTAYTLLLSAGGMEVALVIPAIVCLLAYRLQPDFTWSPRSALKYGFLAGIVILSRLDSLILIAMLLCCELTGPDGRSLRRSARSLLMLGLGASPVLAYAVFNLVAFHAIMPVSGQAKQLRFHHWPSYAPVRYLFYPGSAIKMMLIWPATLAIALTFLWLLVHKTNYKAEQRALPVSLLGFPLAHLLVTSIISDWNLWIWYLYPWIIGLLGCGILLCEFTPPLYNGTQARVLSKLVLVECGLLFIMSVLFVRVHKPYANAEYMASMAIANYVDMHPGFYGMGDRSGLVGYLSQSPVMQLEGLMVDKVYLDKIRRQENLLAVLRHYGVRYYVATLPEAADGCYAAQEPAQAGPDSPRMRATLCSDHVVVFRFHGIDNEIIDLDRLRN